jgi:hypothetical protein
MAGAVSWLTFERLFGIACLVLFVIWVPIYISMPFGRDQGIFAWVGMVLADGGLPYVDGWEQKGPVAHYLYSIPAAVSANIEYGVRVMDLMLLVVAIVIAFSLTFVPGGRLAGVLVAGLLFLTYAAQGYWHTAQPDGWAAWIGLAILLLLVRSESRAAGYSAAMVGLLLAVVFLIKPIYALLGALPVIAYLGYPGASGRQWSNLFKCILFGMVGVVLLLLPFALTGTTGVMIETLFEFNLTSHVSRHRLGWSELASETIQSSPSTLLLCIPAVVGILFLAHAHRRFAAVILTGLVLTLAIAILQQKFYAYHFLPFKAFLIVAAAIGLARLASGLGNSGVLSRAFWSKLLHRENAQIAFIFIILLAIFPLEKVSRDANHFWQWKLLSQLSISTISQLSRMA